MSLKIELPPNELSTMSLANGPVENLDYSGKLDASLVRGGFGFSEIVPEKVVKKCCVQLSKHDNLLFLLNLYSETRQHNILTNIYDYTSPPSALSHCHPPKMVSKGSYAHCTSPPT